MELMQAELYKPTTITPWNHTQTIPTFSVNTPNGIKKSIKIASFYDVHFGHHRTLTDHILKGFDLILLDETYLSTLDMIVFPGDLFDRCLLLTDAFLGHLIHFFSRFILKCHKHDIVIRVLEGTPGHDWKQSKLFQYIMEITGNTVDFAYMETLSIEYIEKLGITMLYVPDEWHADVMVTYEEVQQLLRDRNLEQVDFCLFHGAFGYQIDERLNPKAHSEELWSKIVKYYIFAGHVHIRSQYKNIIVGGSFDRLAHGEEQDKGWITLEITESGEHLVTFHENPNATKYITIDVRNKPIEEILEEVATVVSTLPDHSHIRLYVTDRDEIKDGLKTLRLRHSTIYFTLKTEKKQKQQKTLTLVEMKTNTIDLNRDNIERIISMKLDTLPNIDKEKILQQLVKHLNK